MNDEKMYTGNFVKNPTIQNQLRSFIEKLERLEEEKSALLEIMRDLFSQAKSEGFEPKVMRQVLKLRKMKKEDVVEQEQLLDLYLTALGMGRSIENA